MTRFLEPRLEFIQIVVRVTKALCFAQADAVDDAGVIQRVADDRVLLVEQGLEQSAVGIEARRVEDGVFGTQELARDAASRSLWIAVRAADETH